MFQHFLIHQSSPKWRFEIMLEIWNENFVRKITLCIFHQSYIDSLPYVTPIIGWILGCVFTLMSFALVALFFLVFFLRYAMFVCSGSGASGPRGGDREDVYCSKVVNIFDYPRWWVRPLFFTPSFAEVFFLCLQTFEGQGDGNERKVFSFRLPTNFKEKKLGRLFVNTRFFL